MLCVCVAASGNENIAQILKLNETNITETKA